MKDAVGNRSRGRDDGEEEEVDGHCRNVPKNECDAARKRWCSVVLTEVKVEERDNGYGRNECESGDGELPADRGPKRKPEHGCDHDPEGVEEEATGGVIREGVAGGTVVLSEGDGKTGGKWRAEYEKRCRQGLADERQEATAECEC
jgi:hypothetical protein